MNKSLSKSETVESDLSKLDKPITRQTILPMFGHSTEFDYKRNSKYLCQRIWISSLSETINYKCDIKYLSKILKQCITDHTLDLDLILHFLSSYNCEQRLIIVRVLEFEYNYNLIDMIYEQPESPLRSCTLAMLIEPIELYVRNFHDFILLKQANTTDNNISRILVEILLSLNNDDIQIFKETYEYLFQKSVENDIKIIHNKQSIITELLIQLLEGKRYEDSDYSSSMTEIIAKKLYKAGNKSISRIDYNKFINIFTHESFSQLLAIFDLYENKYGQSIQETIKRIFQGEIETKCFQDIIEYTRSPWNYYSNKLRQALDKTSINYKTLIRIIIAHQDKDLCKIKLEYSKIYGETLDQTIKNHIDIMEIKRLFIMIITNEQIPFDHLNNNSSTTSSRITSSLASSTLNANRLRRNRSQETFDKFINVFKTKRVHSLD